MPADSSGYYGCYCLLDLDSGDSHINFDGNMLAVGGELDWTPELHVTLRGKEVPRVVLGRGSQAFGFIPDDVFRHVKILLEEGWGCRAFSALSIFNKLEDSYSAEVAIICYAPDHEAELSKFAQLMQKRIAKGEHPAVKLSPKELERVLAAGGAWADTKEAPKPKLGKMEALYKTKQTSTERAALAAVEGNKGCYIGLIACAVVLIAAIWFFFFR